MKRAIWLCALWLATVVGVAATTAQERPGFVSPEISADHRVTYRIAAPSASEVLLNGPPGPAPPAGSTASTANPGNWVMPMQKGADGIWSLTVGPLAPDVYRYNFIVDGVRALDLTNPKISSGGSQPWSYFEVPGDPPPIHSRRNVPHGSVQLRAYDVSGMNKVHTLQIYTPPDYDRFPRKTFPVLYLFDGGGDAEDGWVRLGRVPEIEENLLAEHKAVPMIVVMAFSDDDGDATRPEAIADFTHEFFNDIKPLVEKDYRVKTDRAHQAIGGRANGATQAVTLGLRNMDKFASIVSFSAGAPISSPTFDMDTFMPGFLENAAAVNQKMKLLFFSVGDKDTRYPSEVRLDQILTQAGIHHEFHVTPGQHEWKTGRTMLALAMPKLFQSGR
jgi:enterochelin esterase family protein